MRTFYKLGILIVLALLLSLGIGSAYGAPKFPEKPITLVVHSAPGGGSDSFARMLAAANDKEKFLPQPIVVENKPGGSGAVAFAYVAGKRKDPYFLVTTVSSFLTTPLLTATGVTYKDFTPIASFANDENILIVNANSKYKSLKDIVAAAKAAPETLTVGTQMAGSLGAICTYQFETSAGIRIKNVVLGSGADSVVQVLGGHVDMTICNPGEALELAKANKVRILGVFAQKRLAEAPAVPTFKDEGFDNVPGAPNNRGLCAPGGIPEDARKVLEAAFFRYSKSETWKKYVKDNMLALEWMDGPTYGKWLKEQDERYRTIYKEIGVLKEKK